MDAQGSKNAVDFIMKEGESRLHREQTFVELSLVYFENSMSLDDIRVPSSIMFSLSVIFSTLLYGSFQLLYCLEDS